MILYQSVTVINDSTDVPYIINTDNFESMICTELDEEIKKDRGVESEFDEYYVLMLKVKPTNCVIKNTMEMSD